MSNQTISEKNSPSASQGGYRLKDWVEKPERLAPGHRMCAGCGATIGVRAVLRALHEGDHAVIGIRR